MISKSHLKSHTVVKDTAFSLKSESSQKWLLSSLLLTSLTLYVNTVGIEIIHWLKNTDFYSLRPHLAMASVEHSIWHQQKPMLSTWYDTILGVISQLLVEDWLHWTTFIVKRKAFCCYWNRQLLWIWTYLPCAQCFHQNYHPLTWPFGLCTTRAFHAALFWIKDFTLQ